MQLTELERSKRNTQAHTILGIDDVSILIKVPKWKRPKLSRVRLNQTELRDLFASKSMMCHHFIGGSAEWCLLSLFLFHCKSTLSSLSVVDSFIFFLSENVSFTGTIFRLLVYFIVTHSLTFGVCVCVGENCALRKKVARFAESNRIRRLCEKVHFELPFMAVVNVTYLGAGRSWSTATALLFSYCSLSASKLPNSHRVCHYLSATFHSNSFF